MKILPCPFCGADPVAAPSGKDEAGLMIHCIEPNCVGPHVSFYEHDVAIRLWNRRTPAQSFQVREGAAK